MSKDLHVVPELPLPAGQSWNKATSCLTLDKAGTLTVTVPDFDKYIDSIYSKPTPFTPLKEEVLKNMTRDSKAAYKKKSDDYTEAKSAYKNNVAAVRDSVQWAWQLVHKGIDPDKINHNNSFSKGISVLNFRKINFPKILEGGGLSWLEIFTEENPPLGKAPHGMFIRALGTPKVISAEWRDHEGKLIKEEIAYGSTVYLHVYTQALYEQKIEIQLRDTRWVNADLTPTPSDEDGDPIQKLDTKQLTRFTRLVNVHKYDASTKPPAGTVTDALINDKGKEQVSSANVQKCMFPVFIEQAWQIEGGEKLEINPIVYHAKIEDGKIDLDNCVLKVSKEGVLKKGELTGNNPLMQGEAEEGGMPEEKKKINFTFGVFIDGTLNNMYNTIARQAWEEDQVKGKYTGFSNKELQGFINDPEERLKAVALSQEDVGNEKNSRYKYDQDSSFENDLSNPAILFKNYLKDNKAPDDLIFKIYTEGMGTNTLNDDESIAETGTLPVENYKDDDVVQGTGFGQGKAGILDRVERAVKMMADKIIEMNEKEVGTITVDVFGFSRGAASARCFVHEITRQAYSAHPITVRGRIVGYEDANGYKVNDKYSDKKLPSNGRLGYHLTGAKNPVTFDKLIIRFAGLYDTVPHHGFAQWNDINDLGLNSISKAKYTVHMVAADEHRANFNLADISCITGKKGGGKTDRGIELYLPGVHCDVGGSYVEGRSEKNGRMMVSSMWGPDIRKEKDRLITEGWFTKDELTIHWDNAQRTIINGVARVLSSNREAVSNQYSYIPLQLMAKFCLSKGVGINETKLKNTYDFKNTKFSKISFLEKIKARLDEYAFKDGQPFVYQEVPMRTIVYSSDDNTAILKEEERRKDQEKELNSEIRELRHDYLHWNAVYGEGIVNTIVQPNSPNFEGGKRKRKVNG